MSRSTRRQAGHAAALLVLVLAPGLSVAGQDRLPSRSVKLDVEGTTLWDALPPIGRQARILLLCGRNASDRRVFLFSQDRPLDDVMRSLERFIPYGGGTARTFKDGAGWVFEEDLLSRGKRYEAGQRRLREAAEYRRARLREMTEWVRPREGEPRAAAQSRKQTAEILSLFQQLPASARETALDGRKAVVPFRDLSPSAQSLVFGKTSGMRSFRGDSAVPTFSGDRDYKRITVEVVPTGTPGRPGLSVRLMGGTTGLGLRDILHGPEWKPAEGWDWAALWKDYFDRPRGPRDKSKYLQLQRAVTIQARRGMTIGPTLREMTRVSGLPVLGEYDPCYPTSADRTWSSPTVLRKDSVNNLPVWQALDTVCRQFDLDWDFQGGWIWIRSPRTVLSWAGEVDLSPPAARPAER